LGVLLVVLIVSLRPAGTQQPDKPRNPFGVKDVADVDGQDVKDFAATVKLAGDDKDANAAQWVKEATTGKKGSLDGEWHERWNSTGGNWNNGKGVAKVKTVGDRVFILTNSANGRFLMELKKEKNRLVGKWQGLDDPSDTGPCVFLIVSGERLDGNWGGHGRWDFRRKVQ